MQAMAQIYSKSLTCQKSFGRLHFVKTAAFLITPTLGILMNFIKNFLILTKVFLIFRHAI